jgi:hypothetical protein
MAGYEQKTDTRPVDFAMAAVFFEQAQKAYTNGDVVHFEANRTMLILALGGELRGR